MMVRGQRDAAVEQLQWWDLCCLFRERIKAQICFIFLDVKSVNNIMQGTTFYFIVQHRLNDKLLLTFSDYLDAQTGSSGRQQQQWLSALWRHRV